jgi:hypothetical protein
VPSICSTINHLLTWSLFLGDNDVHVAHLSKNPTVQTQKRIWIGNASHFPTQVYKLANLLIESSTIRTIPNTTPTVQTIELCFSDFDTWQHLLANWKKDDVFNLENFKTYEALQRVRMEVAYHVDKRNKLRKELEVTYLNDMKVLQLGVDEIHKYTDKRADVKKQEEKYASKVEEFEKEEKTLVAKWEIWVKNTSSEAS